jgi:hypothetical protein
MMKRKLTEGKKMALKRKAGQVRAKQGLARIYKMGNTERTC